MSATSPLHINFFLTEDITWCVDLLAGESLCALLSVTLTAQQNATLQGIVADNQKPSCLE